MTEKSELKVASILELTQKEEDESLPEISGFAIHPGIFNKVVEIPVDELQNIENSLKTAQLRYDHGYSIFHVIGKVNSAEKKFDYDADKEGVFYKAEIDSEDENGSKVFRKIDRGYINATSIGFMHDSICSKCGEDFNECKHWFDEAHVIAKNCEVFELSVVTKGADSDATATVAGLNDKFVSKFKEQFGGKVMEPKKEGNHTLDVGELFGKMEEVTQLSAQKDQKIVELEDKLAKFEKFQAQFETFKTDVEGQIKAKDTQIEELEDKLTKATKELSDVDAKERQIVATDLVERQIELGFLKEAEKEDEISALTESGDLESVARFVERAEAQKETKLTKGEGKVPKVQNLTKEGQEDEIDYDNLTDEQEQAILHQLFGYDTVFKGDAEEGVIPGHTFMGAEVKR